MYTLFFFWRDNDVRERRKVVIFNIFSRLQNSPYFCVFKYAGAVKQKVWNEAENRERDWGEMLQHKGYYTALSRLTRPTGVWDSRGLRA